MQRTDRWLGLALALLAAAVLWSARAFPNVPGQKLGAGFLPMLVGAGLLLCGVALVLRSVRAAAYAGAGRRRGAQARTLRQFARRSSASSSSTSRWPTALGFLIVAPLGLLAVFQALRVNG